MLAVTPQEASLLRDFGLSMGFYAGTIAVAFEIIVGATMVILAGLIFWRKSDDWVGVMVSFTLLVILNGLSPADDALVRLVPSLSGFYAFLNSLSIVPLVLFLYLFPTGRFVPRWTRFFAVILTGAALIDPILKASVSQIASGEMSRLLAFVFLAGLILGVFAQIYRYRRVSSLIQRQQTKWVVFGMAALILSILIWIPVVELFPLQPGLARLTFNLLGYGLLIVPLILAFPVSVTFSIFRYRLWDIDIVIKRVLVYGLLTGTLLLIYFGSVIVLQTLLQAFTGEGSKLVIVASTLAIAALFNPLRRRIQALIDRRFYRRKYGAEQVLARFGATLRDQVDLDGLSESLLTLLEKTIQPEHVSLWLPAPQRRTSTWDKPGTHPDARKD